eukprot:contig_36232_g8616
MVAGRPAALVCEEEVARLLTLHRNQWMGGVQRQRGQFDVLSVMRVTAGVALDGDGFVVGAVDMVSAASGTSPTLPVVTLTPRDNGGAPRAVLAGEAALLSLGRGVLADPSWLGASFPGTINASVVLDGWHDGTGQPMRRWSLRHGTPATNASRWLQGVATILCSSPSASFVTDSGYCDGVRQRQPARRAPLRAGGHPVAASLGLGDGHHAGWSETGLLWKVNRPDVPVTAPACPPSFARVTRDTTQPRQPLWLLGRGDRELHATGRAAGTEAGLARRLSSCALNGTASALPFVPLVVDDSALTAQLAQRYRRDIFQVDPPADPISDAELILAVLVVVPEAAGLLL